MNIAVRCNIRDTSLLVRAFWDCSYQRKDITNHGTD